MNGNANRKRITLSSNTLLSYQPNKSKLAR